MLIDLCTRLINTVVNKGISDEIEDMLFDYFDIVNVTADKNIDDVPILQTQALLLILTDYQLLPRIKRLTESVRLKLITSILGPMWRHGLMNATYQLVTKNKVLDTQLITYESYEDGTVSRKYEWSIQPLGVRPDLYVYNDYAQATSNLVINELKNKL